MHLFRTQWFSDPPFTGQNAFTYISKRYGILDRSECSDVGINTPRCLRVDAPHTSPTFRHLISAMHLMEEWYVVEPVYISRLVHASRKAPERVNEKIQ